MLFPNFVYQCPGNHQCNGGTYSYLSVQNEEELKAALKLGWKETLPQAQGKDIPKEEPKKCIPVKKEIVKDLPKKEEPKIEEPEEVKIEDVDYKNLSWNELRGFAKKIEADKGVEIIGQGFKKEDIIKRLNEVL